MLLNYKQFTNQPEHQHHKPCPLSSDSTFKCRYQSKNDLCHTVWAFFITADLEPVKQEVGMCSVGTQGTWDAASRRDGGVIK